MIEAKLFQDLKTSYFSLVHQRDHVDDRTHHLSMMTSGATAVLRKMTWWVVEGIRSYVCKYSIYLASAGEVHIVMKFIVGFILLNHSFEMTSEA